MFSDIWLVKLFVTVVNEILLNRSCLVAKPLFLLAISQSTLTDKINFC